MLPSLSNLPNCPSEIIRYMTNSGMCYHTFLSHYVIEAVHIFHEMAKHVQILLNIVYAIQGAMFGGIVGVCLTMWLNIGSLSVKKKHPTLPPISIENCIMKSPFNETLVTSSLNHTLMTLSFNDTIAMPFTTTSATALFVILF